MDEISPRNVEKDALISIALSVFLDSLVSSPPAFKLEPFTAITHETPFNLVDFSNLYPLAEMMNQNQKLFCSICSICSIICFRNFIKFLIILNEFNESFAKINLPANKPILWRARFNSPSIVLQTVLTCSDFSSAFIIKAKASTSFWLTFHLLLYHTNNDGLNTIPRFISKLGFLFHNWSWRPLFSLT